MKHQLPSVLLFEEMDFYLCCEKSLSLTFSRRAGGGARKRNSDTRRKRRGAGWSHFLLSMPFFVHSSALSLRLFLLLFKFGFVKVVTCISLSCYMDLSKLIPLFLFIVMWIYQNWYRDFLCCYMDLSKLQHTIVEIVTWICCPLLNNNQDLKPYRSFCFELKVLNESKLELKSLKV